MSIGHKVLISVAPVAATDKEIDPKKIAEDVIACARAGAAMVHLHVRNEKGQLTTDMSVLRKTIQLIQEKSDIIIEVSTGGVSNLTIEERCIPLKEDIIEACSLNVGSTNLGNAVYCNPIPDVKYCVSEIIKSGKTPEVEVFELGHIHTLNELKKEFAFKEPLLCSIVLGHPGEAPATPEALMAMIQFMPKDMYWGITHAYRKEFSLIAGAIGMGAKTVRIGFEDSRFLDEKTEAINNLQLVEKTVQLLRAMDKAPMTSNEARKLFNI